MQREPFLVFCYIFSPTCNITYTQSILCKWKEVNSSGWQEAMWERFLGFGRHYGCEVGNRFRCWGEARVCGSWDPAVGVRGLSWGFCLGLSPLHSSLPCPRPASGQPCLSQRDLIHSGGVGDQVIHRDLLQRHPQGLLRCQQGDLQGGRALEGLCGPEELLLGGLQQSGYVAGPAHGWGQGTLC